MLTRFEHQRPRAVSQNVHRWDRAIKMNTSHRVADVNSSASWGGVKIKGRLIGILGGSGQWLFTSGMKVIPFCILTKSMSTLLHCTQVSVLRVPDGTHGWLKKQKSTTWTHRQGIFTLSVVQYIIALHRQI